MKNALKLMAVALVMFAFSSNVSAATVAVAGVAKCASVDQDGNGGVKVKKHCDKDGDKKECSKDKKEGKSCCKKDGKKADKKSCCKKEETKKEADKKAE